MSFKRSITLRPRNRGQPPRLENCLYVLSDLRMPNVDYYNEIERSLDRQSVSQSGIYAGRKMRYGCYLFAVD